MSRTRIISQNKAVYVSDTGLAGSPEQLRRIDTFSFDVDLAGSRQDIREFGQLARIATVRMSELTPTVSFGYYLTNGENESKLGLNTSGSDQLISKILTQTTLDKEKNIYVVTVGEGIDAFSSGNFTGNRNQHDVVAFGNASLSSYTAAFSVGEIPRADVEMECGNIVFYTGSSGLANPALNRETAVSLPGTFTLSAPSTGNGDVDVLRAGDVTVNFTRNSTSLGGADFSGIHIQSANIEVPLARTPIERLGSELPFARPLEFPINVTCSINGIVNDFVNGSLQSVLTGCAFGGGTDITITVNDRCNDQPKMRWTMKNAVLDSQNFSVGLDDQETVDLTFSAQIGGAGTTDAGIFMSGAY
jgi:hypothetical protein